ncbi:unnamed protein product [Closterium sp. Yama58-4]|nr:unnamed protein product [Closterium sp. Yama58-4]
MSDDGNSGGADVAVLSWPEARLEVEQASKDGAHEQGVGTGDAKGLGIVEFLRGKHILVTGATGFLAKALVEKILREQPDVGRLYLFIQPRADQPAQQRLEQLVESPIFGHLRSKHGSAYEQFMAAKLGAVEGDISIEGLGLSASVLEEIRSKVQVVINSAATTTFDERYDVALNINTQGPRRLLELAHSCPYLQLLLHVSTAFVNGRRRGRCMERPFNYGDTIAAELQQQQGTVAQGQLDIETEIALAEKERLAAEAAAEAQGMSKEDVQAAVQKHMVDLGMSRAQQCGWQDTYVFTKAMGEMVLTRGHKDLPLAIVRPSIVESCLNEPMAGWMEGMRMADPILLAYGKGQMAGFLANPDGVLDMIPCDKVINAVLAIATHTASLGYGAPVSVYHVATSVANPLGIQLVADATSDHFAHAPMLQRDGSAVTVQRMQVFRHPQLFMLDVWLKYQLPLQLAKLFPWNSSLSDRRNNLLLKTAQQLSYLAKLYEPYTFYAARFDASNTEHLFSLMSEEEQQHFNFDLRSIDWHTYLFVVSWAVLYLFVSFAPVDRSDRPHTPPPVRMEDSSSEERAVWQCEDVLARLWASGAFDDAKSIVDMAVLTGVDAIRLALTAANELSAEEARRIVSQHLAPAGADLHAFTPPDFHPHPPSFLPRVVHPPTRQWALSVHRLWPLLSFRTAPPSTAAATATASHPVRTLPTSPSTQPPCADPKRSAGGEREVDVGAAPEVQQQDDAGQGRGAPHDGLVMQGGSLLALPHAPVIIPGERFREMYYWDTYWVIRGLLVSGMLDSALAAVRNLLHLARTHAHVPNGSRAYYLNRSQPPLLSNMVRAVHAALQAQGQGEQGQHAQQDGEASAWSEGARMGRSEQAESLLREALPVLVREHEFWTQAPHGITVYHPPSGRSFNLSRYYAMWTHPRPESFPQDTETARVASQRPLEHLQHGTSPRGAAQVQAALFRELATVAESGWDFSSRWMRDPSDFTSSHPTAVLPADLNALLFQLETNVAALATLLLSTLSSPHDAAAAPAEGAEAAAVSGAWLAEVAARFGELVERRREAMDVMMWCQGEHRQGGGGVGDAAAEGGRVADGGNEQVGRWRDVWIQPGSRGVEEGGTAADAAAHEWVAVAPHCDTSACASSGGAVQGTAPSGDVYASDYIPLWCGLLPPGDPRIDLVVASLQSSNLLLPAGIATSTRFTGQQWDYPNVWPPLHHAICEALLLTASPRAIVLARPLAHRFLATAREAFERTGAMHEKYDGRQRGAVGSGGEYNPQVGFGWTNGAVLSLLDLFAGGAQGRGRRKTSLGREGTGLAGRGRAMGEEQPAEGAVESVFGQDVTHGYVSNGDVKLHYVHCGAPHDPLLLCLHGFPSFWYTWKHQFHFFASRGYHVVAPDLRGYSWSGKPPDVAAYSRAALLSDVAALAAHFGVREDADGQARSKMVLVGHDWGGNVAWEFAHDHPALLHALVICNMPHPSAFHAALRSKPSQMRRSWYIFLFQLGHLGESFMSLNNFYMLRGVVQRDPKVPQSQDDVQRHVAAFSIPGALTAAINLYRAAFHKHWLRPDTSHATVEVPVLMLWGDDDWAFNPDLSQPPPSLVPNCQVIHFPQASHWVMWDEQEQVNERMHEFITAAMHGTPASPTSQHSRSRM